MDRWRWVGGLLGLAASAAATQAAEVRVAVAANFAAPMAVLSSSFSAATGHKVTISTGATGRFYAQIVAGAPFELLLAADQATPQRLLAEGHAVPGSTHTYALGRLVLWSAKPGFVDAEGAVLASGSFARLAVASPKLAPYGAAALQVLAARGLAERLDRKLVTGENIAQTYQFVATGNAELGFVALSQVKAPGQAVRGSWWLVPSSLHAPVRQDVVLLKAGAANPAAAALLAYLKSDAARRVIASYGYGVDAR